MRSARAAVLTTFASVALIVAKSFPRKWSVYVPFSGSFRMQSLNDTDSSSWTGYHASPLDRFHPGSHSFEQTDKSALQTAHQYGCSYCDAPKRSEKC